MLTRNQTDAPANGGRIRLGNRSIALPASRLARIALGAALIFGGLFGFLPVLGLWMIPLGLIVLSVDLAPVRRLRRRAQVWLRRRFGRARTAAAPVDRRSAKSRS